MGGRVLTNLRLQFIEHILKSKTSGRGCGIKISKYVWRHSIQFLNQFVFQFLFSCKGNSNRFSTLESCENSCKHHSLLITAKRRCSLPKKAGSPQCTKKEAKWFFDTKAKGCRPFIFSGCDGNENSFDSVDECEQACPNAFPPEIEVITKVRQKLWIEWNHESLILLSFKFRLSKTWSVSYLILPVIECFRKPVFG